MEIRSSAFFIGSTIPFKYTCDGDNISPPVHWESPPEGTNSFALILDDPDAPNQTFTHWVVYNLPAGVRELPEAVPKHPRIAKGGMQGKNSAGEIGFTGPCPPNGTHRYYFKVFALDQPINLPPGASKEEVIKAMDGHVLDAAEVMGRYARETSALL